MPTTRTDTAAPARITVRDLIAVVPDEVPHDALSSARALLSHLDAEGVPTPRFLLTRPARRPWRHRQLVTFSAQR